MSGTQLKLWQYPICLKTWIHKLDHGTLTLQIFFFLSEENVKIHDKQNYQTELKSVLFIILLNASQNILQTLSGKEIQNNILHYSIDSPEKLPNSPLFPT